MRLHVHIEGAGADLVLLHGWGLNSAIWDGLAAQFAQAYRLHRIDLPGHGRSQWTTGSPTRLDDFARAVARYIPRGATVLGWSLGGIVALRLAKLLPERITRLVLVSTTPRFVTGHDWSAGMMPTVLANFGAHLRNDFRGTVQDFLALQVRGGERELASLRELRQRLHAGGLPEPAALEAGLEILRTVDLRESLPALTQPTLVIAGEYDRVTPPGAGEHLARRLAHAEFRLIPRAGHAPFISHAQDFNDELRRFLECEPDVRSVAIGS